MPCLSLFRIILSISGSSAASVVPDPVGAIMRTLSPWAIRGMASTCGGVGVEIPVSWSSPFSGGDSNVNVSGATEFLLFAVDRIGELEDKLPRLLKVSGFRTLLLLGYFLQECLVIVCLHKAR